MREINERQRKQYEEIMRKRAVEEELERERIKKAHEERVKRELERIEREKEERAEQKRIEIENQKRLEEEKAKNEAERERIRKQNEELERIELERMEEHFKRLQELKQKKLEDQKRAEEEQAKRERIEKEKADKEAVEKAIQREKLAAMPVTPYDPYIKSAKAIIGEIDLNACFMPDKKYIGVAKENYECENTLNKNWTGKIWLDILGTKTDSKCYIEKLIHGYLDGAIKEAFVIARNDTGADWFKLISQKAQAVVFPLNGELTRHAIIYFGNNTEAFMKECIKYGWGTVLNN